MTARLIYQEICTEDNPGTYIGKLGDIHLASLISHLADAASGVPGLILGMAESESSRRWLEDQKDRSGAVGEGGL